MALPADVERAIETSVERLRRVLGDNLSACLLYGSGIRGDLNPDVSDIDLLIVLRESTPEAHAAIADAIRGPHRIDPFVLGTRGLERSFRAFAVKFRSIQRNYRVLHGRDPFDGFDVDERTIRLECEQTLRNVRLRVVHAYISFGHDFARYSRYLIDVTADTFVSLSEVPRLDGVDIPHDLPARLPMLQAIYEADVRVLRDLLDLKKHPRVLSAPHVADFHARLFRLLDKAVGHVERRWQS